MAKKKTQKADTSPDVPMITIYLMGKGYEVPAGLTIMKAVEYAGYRYIRGAGCRAGFCGACGALYRKEGDHRFHASLACQTTAEDGMYLAQLPFIPANKAKYDLEKVELVNTLGQMLYPEIARCLSCNTCTKICPQDIEVMDYVQAALRGDFTKASEISFDCIQCGLCAARCPAEIPQYHIGQLTRRLHGKFEIPRSQELADRVDEVDAGKFDEELAELKAMGLDDLKTRYSARDRED